MCDYYINNFVILILPALPFHLDNPLDVHLSQPENEKRPFLVVVEVPAARKVLSDDFRQLILGQDLVDAVFLPPGTDVVKLFTAVIYECS